MPMNAITITAMGISQLNTAQGAYMTSSMPKVVEMNTPQVFQGISAEVTVPALSSALDRHLGCRP